MPPLDDLRRFLARHRKVLVLTGAGCSTASAIPDYRDDNGQWKRRQPVMYGDFIADAAVRKRYWGRSLVGWQHFARATPNPAHRVLAAMEAAGTTAGLITQNVDDLHQRAGSRQVLALHGTLDKVRCLDCRTWVHRDAFQHRLRSANAAYGELSAPAAPDGDADLDEVDFSGFRVPDCVACGGLLKPDVTFYGESVPRERYERGEQWLAAADALLVVGSSLMVYSSFRFARRAAEWGKPIAAINLGRTRADDLLAVKVAAPCEQVLPRLAETMEPGPGGQA